MHTQLSNFAARLREQLLLGRCENFDQWVLELFALQFKYNGAYRKICEARGLTPQTVEHWTQIPAVPAAAFKELELTSLSPDERTAVFHSSGTTEQKPSRHFHNAESLAVYETSLWSWFKENFDEAGEMVFLTPNQTAAPRSSLVQMFEIIRHATGLPESAFTGRIDGDGAWVVDFDTTVEKLRTACEAGKPLTLLGTAFSFVHLLDHLAENQLSFRLPHGSRVMETGGYKNRSRVLAKAELHALIWSRLGVPRGAIICEYGMSELSSQAYDSEIEISEAGGWRYVLHFPPWARVQIVSPETGREVNEGETGIIRIFDLANVYSVAVIQTEDLGVRHADGFELIGRANASEPRGCSLMTA
jgi:hypothetical protein